MQLMKNDILKSVYIMTHSTKSHFRVVAFVYLRIRVIHPSYVSARGEQQKKMDKLMNQTESCDFTTLCV